MIHSEDELFDNSFTHIFPIFEDNKIMSGCERVKENFLLYIFEHCLEGKYTKGTFPSVNAYTRHVMCRNFQLFFLQFSLRLC